MKGVAQKPRDDSNFERDALRMKVRSGPPCNVRNSKSLRRIGHSAPRITSHNPCCTQGQSGSNSLRVSDASLANAALVLSSKIGKTFAGRDARFSESAILFSQVHPPIENEIEQK